MSPEQTARSFSLSRFSLCFCVLLTQLLMSKRSNFILVSSTPLSRPRSACRRHSIYFKTQTYFVNIPHQMHIVTVGCVFDRRAGFEKDEAPKNEFWCHLQVTDISGLISDFTKKNKHCSEFNFLDFFVFFVIVFQTLSCQIWLETCHYPG